MQQIDADKEARKLRFQPKGQTLGPVTIQGGNITPAPVGTQPNRSAGAAAGTPVSVSPRQGSQPGNGKAPEDEDMADNSDE